MGKRIPEEKKQEIAKRWAERVTQPGLAKEYGVSLKSIANIVARVRKGNLAVPVVTEVHKSEGG